MVLSIRPATYWQRSAARLELSPGAVLETSPGGAQAKYPRRDHLSFAAAGANAFALERYLLQVQNKINCSG